MGSENDRSLVNGDGPSSDRLLDETRSKIENCKRRWWERRTFLCRRDYEDQLARMREEMEALTRERDRAKKERARLEEKLASASEDARTKDRELVHLRKELELARPRLLWAEVRFWCGFFKCTLST